MKLMKKIKGTWVAVAVANILLSIPVSQYVKAAERGFSQSILSSESQSEFELKAYLVKNRLHIEESQKAIESIKDKWSENSVEDIKKKLNVNHN